MSGLIDSVALAIAKDQECGGADILTECEVSALMSGALLLKNEERHEEGDTLRMLAVELGKTSVCFIDPPPKHRVTDYYRHCATVAINAYDKWLEQRHHQPETHQ